MWTKNLCLLLGFGSLVPSTCATPLSIFSDKSQLDAVAQYVDSVLPAARVDGLIRPKIVKQFASTTSYINSGASIDILESYTIYDEVIGQQTTIQKEILPFSKATYTINANTYLNKETGYLTINDRCQPLPRNDKFAPAFTWLQAAQPGGTTTVTGRSCNLWSIHVPVQNISLSICVDSATNSLPISQNISTSQYHQNIIYGADIHSVLNVTDKKLESIPTQCSTEKPPICDGGTVEKNDVYIFHPANQFDIYNEDVADLLGDTAFICADAVSNNTQIDAYQWVSKYSLQVWSGWGDYAECNRPSPHEPGICISFETYAVGREASYALKPRGGQCTNNSDFGTWLSLPKDGQCQNETQTLGPEGDGNCSWRILEKYKTINGSCLLNTQGMFQSCLEEGDFPFEKTQSILFTAFNSSELSEGGCPDISDMQHLS